MLDLSSLNENQKKAVEFMDGPCLVIACAGTGKTTVLVNRVANLIDKGVNEENILLLTFTNKAANEMKARACKMLGKDELNLTACTYHSFCVSYLRKYASLLGINNNFTIVDSSDSAEIMKIIKEEKGLTELENFPNPKTLVSIFSQNINKEISISEIIEIECSNYKKYLSQIESLQKDYKEYKLNKNILDYDDILVFFLNLIQKNPNICKNISDVYEFIMVDEYQDSNGLQFKILQELRKFDNKNLMVVGDEQQCLPIGTKILTTNGYKNIEEISLDDSLIVAGGKGITCNIKPELISKKKYTGKLFKIRTRTGRELSATPNHIIFADYHIEKKYFVYLMYLKEFGFRIGKSSSYGDSNRNGYETRMTQEGAERVWLLRVCDNEKEASFFENYYAFQYGIPLYVFKPRNKNNLSQDDIFKLYSSINTVERGHKLLNDLDLFFDYPHFMTQLKSSENGRNFRRLNFSMFGSARIHKTGVFNGYKHELAYNTIDDEFDRIGNKYMGTNSSKKKNVYGCNYKNGRKVTGNQDELLDIADNILSELDTVYFRRQACLVDKKKYDFAPMSNLRVGMHICFNQDGKIIEDEIISVEQEFYDDYVYDLNVPYYRNYIANDIVVHNCIYGFRGSKFENIMHFPEQFENAELIILDENYRSNQEILDVANILIEQARDKYPKSLKSNKLAKRKPILLEAYNSEEEANYIIDEMEKFLCPPYNYSMKDIAVLIRSSRDSYILESLLTKKYYSYEKFGGIKFLERTFVKDIFAFLKLSVNDKDELSWFRIFQLYPNIGIVYAKKMTEKIAENGIDELLKDEYNGKRYSSYFSEIHGVIEYLKTIDLPTQLDYLINKYYFKLLEKSLDASRKSKNKKEELLKEIKENKEEADVLFEFANGYTSTLKFLTDLTLEIPEKSKDEDRLTISTVHSAKGLEFKVVFVIHCIEGSYPSLLNSPSVSAKAIKKEQDDLEEERRIFYVAVTRAKDYLYLTYPKTRLTYDKRIEKTTLSRFIDKSFKGKVNFEIKERTTWFW